MFWPPGKAWTSKLCIQGEFHFVAINYGGKLENRWVIMMSVLNSSVIVEVSWLQLVDLSKWESGWDENNYLTLSKSVNRKYKLKNTNCIHLSSDSGLTIPITKDIIRPWFYND